MPGIPHRNQQGALPLHLTLTMLPWLASCAALPLSKSGWTGWNMPPSKAPGSTEAALRSAWLELLRSPPLAEAVEKEARKRAVEFLEGLHQYQNSSFTRDVAEPDTVLRVGNARLLHYGAGDPALPVLLLIPSLINRYYILDLTQRLSFARYLSGRGFGVYVVDWGDPGEHERDFDCARYVTRTLFPMAQWIRAQSKRPLAAAGYCMGGLLTMALVQLKPHLIDACAFLATPWDFSVPEFPRFQLKPDDLPAVEQLIAGRDTLSAETIHTLFHCANPYAFQAKLRQFARMDKSHPSVQEFLAIEHWVNDGVPMTRGVARDCLLDWTQHNAPASGKWRVGGKVIDPARIKMPSFLAVPRDDRIVPASCARPLARLLHQSTLIEPASGHVGMMAGRNRRAGLWEPFAEWAAGIS